MNAAWLCYSVAMWKPTYFWRNRTFGPHVWCALTTENHLLKWMFTVIRLQKEMSGQGGDGGDRSDEAGAKRDWRVKIWVDKFPLFPPNKALICKYVFVVTTEFSTSGGFLNTHWIQVHSRKYNNEELNFFTFKNSGATINSLWRAKKEQMIFFN